MPKNHSFLIEIFKKINDRNEDSVLLLIGDGELRLSIEKKVKDFLLTDNVIFAGVRSDIPELLQAIDVFVFPSLFEGLPVTLIEAQASGLYCIVSDSITKEVKITDSIEFISLDHSLNHWTNRILNYRYVSNREDYCKKVKENGYDINTVATWLQDFYLNCEISDA